MKRSGFIVLALVLASVLAAAADVNAANLHDPSGSFSGLLELVRNNANQWSMRLRNFALYIFWSLATIQLVWTLGPMLVRRADLGEALAEITMFTIKTVLFLSLLVYSVEWGEAIVNSFRHAGAAAAGVPTSLRPGDMFDLAVTLAKTVSDVDVDIFQPLTGVGIALSALVILIGFAFIAAFMGVTLIESYIVINASMFLMGFGGAEITRQYAIAPVRYALAVGAKLFVLTLIVGLILSSAKEWQMAYRHDSASTWTLAGLAIICAILTKTVTDMIGALISGVSPGSGSILGNMAAAGMAVGGAAVAAATAKASGMMGEGGFGGGLASTISSSLSGGGGGSSGSMPGGSSGGGSSKPPTPPAGGYQMGMGAAPFSQATSAPQAGGGLGGKTAKAAHTATAAAARTGGLMASIAVPGMEGVENLSIGHVPDAPPSASGGAPVSMSSPPETPENVIRPDSPSEPAEDTANQNRRNT